MRVFITGGSGLVGTRLIKKLRERDDDVVLLTRRDSVPGLDPNVRIVVGDPSVKGSWMDAIKDCDGVVNLVGEGVFNRRWSADFKTIMYKSRIDSTRNVTEALQAIPKRADGSPKVLVSASAIGYYGPHGDEVLTETSGPSPEYLAQLCVDWENATQPAQAAGVRVAMLRVGVVLDKNGGALAKMMPPFKMFVGGPIGSGSQYVSWIHHADLVGQILFALDHAEAKGPFNGTAPNPVTNKEFSKALGRALGRPSFMPTPGFMLRLALGEVANVITKGQRVLPKKSLDLGYKFQFSDIDAALKDILA